MSDAQHRASPQRSLYSHHPHTTLTPTSTCIKCDYTGPEALNIATHDTTPATPHLTSDTQHRAYPRPAHCSRPDTPQTHTPAPHRHPPHNRRRKHRRYRHTPTDPHTCTHHPHAYTHTKYVNTPTHLMPMQTALTCYCYSNGWPTSPTTHIPTPHTQPHTQTHKRTRTPPAIPFIASLTPLPHTPTDCNMPCTHTNTTCRHLPFDSRRHARSSPGCTGPQALPAAGHHTTPHVRHSDTQHRASPRPAHC
jgi:hypothetical protein